MKQDMFYEVETLGELGRRAVGVMERPGQEPTAPRGCHWFRDCGECRWEDCRISGNPVRYDSDRGRRMRGMALAGMLQGGTPRAQLAEFFGLTEEQVERQAELGAAVHARGQRYDPEFRPAIIAEAIRRRVGGEPEMLVAETMGVSARQVRRWCEGVDSIKRDDGRRLRGKEYRGFKCTNAGTV